MPAIRVATTALASIWWPISSADASTAGKVERVPIAISTARMEKILVSTAPPVWMTQIPKPDSPVAARADGKVPFAISVNNIFFLLSVI